MWLGEGLPAQTTVILVAPPLERLSTTLDRVAEALPEPCTAGDVVQQILSRHADYAAGRAKRIGETAFQPPSSRKQPVPAWYSDVRLQLKSDLGTLSGKTAILGLAVADRVTGRELVRSGLFACLLDDVTEGIELFSERGRTRLATIPRASFTQSTSPIVLQQPGRAGLRGGLAADGSRAVGYGDDRNDVEVALWSVENAVPIGRLRPPSQVRMVRFSGDGGRIVALLRDGSIVRWRASATDSEGEVVGPPINGVVSGALSTDACCAVVRLNRPGFMVIDLETNERAEIPTNDRLSRISVSADGRWISVASSRSGELYERTGVTAQLITSFAGDHDIRALECGAGMAVVSAGGSLTVYGEHEVRLPTENAERVALSGDGSLLAWVGRHTLTLVQPETGVQLGSLPFADGVVRTTLSLDGRRLLASHTDGMMRVWDVGLEPPVSRPSPARFDSDIADDDRDFLGRLREADAFASLIAAKAVQPPLSIGVFGDWGSGKSWFMGQLKRRVDQITTDTRASHARQVDVSFYKHIAQVQFNAWHYAETDVLSSLVDHVFNRLDLGEATSDAFESGIVVAQTELAQAGLAEKKAASALGAAQGELAALAESRRMQEEQRTSAAAAAARGAVTADQSMKCLLASADAVLKDVGWGGVSGAASEFIAAIRSQRAELTRGNAVLSPLVRGGESELKARRKRAFVLTFVIPVLALVVGTAIGLLDDASLAALAGVGAFVATLLGGVTRVVVAHTRWVHDRLEALAQAERDIEKRIDEQMKPLDESIARTREQELAKTKEVTDKRKSLEDALRSVDEKREELAKKQQPHRVLEDLVDSRIESGDYASKLGVVALARRDFEKVSDLIRAVNESIDVPSAPATVEQNVSINRIVLYIDDLDRCEPDKVAKVLQAVHLLLAFPLFVVVVGVDPRWVGRALKKHYPDLLDGEGVEPNDYLEKIFQIPFWLQPLNDDRTASMLRGLAGAPLASNRPRARRRSDAASGSGSDASGSPDGEAHDESDGVPRTEPKLGAPNSAQLAKSRELNPRGLLLESHEVEAMEQLSPLLGRSPRTLKRFVNVYRLFKVREPDVVDFADADRPDADYLIVLYLLAEVTGRPESASHLFDAIRAAGDADTTVMKDVPAGWPQNPRVYKPWLDEVGRFSFRAMISASGPATPSAEGVAMTSELAATLSGPAPASSLVAGST